VHVTVLQAEISVNLVHAHENIGRAFTDVSTCICSDSQVALRDLGHVRVMLTFKNVDTHWMPCLVGSGP